MNFTKNDSGMTFLGPAVLGGILGFLAYLAWTDQAKSLLLAVLFVAGGMVVVSLAAYAFRRFLLPHDEKDIVE